MSSLEPPDPADTAAPAGLESRPDSLAMSPWRLYWLAVASFGLYVPVWVYRLARAAGQSRSARVSWALGSLVPPVAAALLYELNGRAFEAVPRARQLQRALPAVVFLVLLPVCAFTPLRHFALAPLLLLPAPFAWVQASINRAARAEPGTESIQPIRIRWFEWVIASAGTLLVATAAWFTVPPFLEQLKTLGADGVVAGRSGSYQVVIPTSAWRKIKSGTLGDPDSDLELTGPGTETWTVAYVTPSLENDIPTAVSARRTMIFETGEPRDFSESRRFLDGSDLVPVSTADYEIGYGVLGEGHYVVLTAQTDEEVIELIGYTAEPVAHLEELRRLIGSFAIPVIEGDVEVGP